jgi:hypothetical protein
MPRSRLSTRARPTGCSPATTGRSADGAPTPSGPGSRFKLTMAAGDMRAGCRSGRCHSSQCADRKSGRDDRVCLTHRRRDGFEPLVPQQIRSRFRDSSPVSHDVLTVSRPGTESSNPVPSTGESVAGFLRLKPRLKRLDDGPVAAA